MPVLLQVVSPTAIRVLIQLKLCAGFRNEFESCDVIIPVGVRRRITSIDVKATAGEIFLDTDKSGLIWKIGLSLSLLLLLL